MLVILVQFQGIEHPVRTNQIPRQIPEQSFYTKPLPGIVMGGILPFGCIFIQLFFILNSIWLVLMINGSYEFQTSWKTLRFCKPLILQVPSDVLYVWLPLPGLHHPGHHLLWGHHPPLLLPPVRWGKSTHSKIHITYTPVWQYAYFGESFFICFVYMPCLRTITGSGAPSSPADSQLFISWSMPSITSSLSCRLVDSLAPFFTSATPWSCHSSSSSSQVSMCVEVRRSHCGQKRCIVRSTACRDVTFKPSSFLLVNAANSCD